MAGFGNKEVMAANIRYYMELYGKSRYDVCRALGVSYTTFTDWVNAKKYPRIDKIEKMARLFNITKADLVEPPKTKKDKFTVPVLEQYEDGKEIENMASVLGYEEITEEMARQGKLFAFKMPDNALYPRIRANDILLIRCQENVGEGLWEYGAVLIAGKTYVRKLTHTEEGINVMNGENSDNVSRFYSNFDVARYQIKIIGKVVELRARF